MVLAPHSTISPPSSTRRNIGCSFIRWRDRKSTRLNSSHSQISYAVFCLKKKKKNVKIGQMLTQKENKTTEKYRRWKIDLHNKWQPDEDGVGAEALDCFLFIL